jgi:hypothetical protein
MKTPKHELQTPTFALTTLGTASLAAHLTLRIRHADTLAFIALGLAGAGTAMALGSEVKAKGETWGWKGLARSLRRPSRPFMVTFLCHLPQLVASMLIALKWRRRANDKVEANS